MLTWSVFTETVTQLVIALLEIIVIIIIIIQPKAIGVHNNKLTQKWSLSGYFPDY